MKDTERRAWLLRRPRRSRRACNVHTNVHIISDWRRRRQETIRYQWDPRKAESNQRKHGIRFTDVVAVFEDEMALRLEDPDAEGERRFVVIGRDYCGRVVTVVYTHRQDTLRLISARKASRRERRAYEGGR